MHIKPVHIIFFYLFQLKPTNHDGDGDDHDDEDISIKQFSHFKSSLHFQY